MRGWQRLGQVLLDLLFPPPPRCFFCGRPLKGQGEVCLTCLGTISHPAGPLCLRCGHPLSHEGPCFHCAGKNWAFSRARSVGPYRGELRRTIHRLKFGNEPAAARLLARLMWQSVEAHWWPQLHALVPVPLHKERERERGYNQARLLAYELSLLSGCPMQILLERHLPTPAQVGLSQAARRANMARAFAPVPGLEQAAAGKRILLVDDVLTTGSTLDACARVLLGAGCLEVRALTVALTDRNY